MAKKTDVTPIDLDGDVDTVNDGQTEAQYIAADTWLSVKEATEYTGKKRMQITKAVNSGKLAARTRVVHPEYAPLTEINKVDLDVWNTPKAPKVKIEYVGVRATRGGQARRLMLYAYDEDILALRFAVSGVISTKAPNGYDFTTAYRNKKARDAASAANAEPNAETQAVNLAQIDTPIDLSPPVEQDANAPASTSDELELVEA